MPNTKSAIKDMRKDAERNLRNRSEKSRLVTSEKAFHAKLEEKDVAGAEDALKTVFSNLDKAAKRNTIDASKASRKKARLSARLNKAKA
jgi:small subunit ribosomal protein S20